MKKLRSILKWLLFLLLIAALWNYKLIYYGIGQLRGQLHIVMNAKPIDQILTSANLSADNKRKLLLIAEIKQFAIDSIGLKKSENYTTFYDQENKPALWVLTACEPFSLKAYQWYFPLLGNVSYKGFFIKDNGEKEMLELKKKGYDTDLSPTGGWSTLGWFKDPVMSNFLKRPDAIIAETIIHELTHATVYLKSSVDYNENLATFVGEKGAEKFLAYKYGSLSKELDNYGHYKSDEELYGKLLIKGSGMLDSLYRSFETKNIPGNQKIFLKYKLISQILLEINNTSFYKKEYYHFDFTKDTLPNNTYFMETLRYRKKQDDFEKMFQLKCGSNLKTFISLIKQTN
jgi:predicted aminopeptidase